LQRSRRLLFAGSVAVAAVASAAAAALAGDNDAGFKTAQPAMLTGHAGTTVTPLLSVGDTLGGGYRFESIPDGIAIARTNGKGTVDILVNHETSLVPFPAPSPTVAGRSDFTNAMVSRLRLSQHSAGVLKGDFVIPSSANYQRFCSNFLASKEHGFERDILFTNEEATDFVSRTGTAWPAPPTEPPSEQAGVVVALDVKSGDYKTIYGMGRHNHENSVAIPGFGHPVVLSGDDTFSAPSSQLYLYTAANGAAVWNDQGTLWALQSVDPTVNDYGDVTAGPGIAVQFIEVPRSIAIGGQADLENWSNARNVFQFIRIEDIAYDRNNPRIVYFADTGEPRALPGSPRLTRGPSGTNGPYMNGRIWQLELAADATGTGTLSILPGGDFDAGDYANASVPHQPDNVETTKNAIYIQEDTGSHNSSAPPSAYPPFPDATNARIWRYDLATQALTVVAEVDQSALPGAPKGAWESSGIVDASSVFGPGAFLVDIQAHGLEIERSPNPPVVNQVNYAREAGQLLLIRVANP
jgi:hypothetical protein